MVQWKNTQSAYGAIHKTFHWGMAVLVVGLLAVGLYMTGLPLGQDKLKLYGLHKSFGFIVLLLVIVRYGWRLANIMPALPETVSRFQAHTAHVVHLLLYTLMLAMPLSGWMMSSAAGFPVSVFGLFTLPDLVETDKALRGLFHEVHEIGGFVMIALISLHALAALKHHFMNKDATLKRMLP